MSNFRNYRQPEEYNRDEHIYFNLAIENHFDGVDNGNTNDCVYDKQTPAILKKQSDYELCVDSWQVRAKLPIFICPILEGALASNINHFHHSIIFCSPIISVISQ